MDKMDLHREAMALDQMFARGVEMVLHQLIRLVAAAERAAGRRFHLDRVPIVEDRAATFPV